MYEHLDWTVLRYLSLHNIVNRRSHLNPATSFPTSKTTIQWASHCRWWTPIRNRECVEIIYLHGWTIESALMQSCNETVIIKTVVTNAETKSIWKLFVWDIHCLKLNWSASNILHSLENNTPCSFCRAQKTNLLIAPRKSRTFFHIPLNIVRSLQFSWTQFRHFRNR